MFGKKIKYLVIDIGCLECDQKSSVIGIFDTKKEAKETMGNYLDEEDNKWGRKEWTGQHSLEVFEIKI